MSNEFQLKLDHVIAEEFHARIRPLTAEVELLKKTIAERDRLLQEAREENTRLKNALAQHTRNAEEWGKTFDNVRNEFRLLFEGAAPSAPLAIDANGVSSKKTTAHAKT
jgi:uncharacterized coiled-coil DUF342 family protein